MNNPNLKKFYQNSPKPVNYLPNVLVDGTPQYAPTMSGLMLINPATKDIWVSAGNKLVSDWISIVGGGGGSSVTLKTNNIINPTQSILNLLSNDSSIQIVDDGLGGIDFSIPFPSKQPKQFEIATADETVVLSSSFSTIPNFELPVLVGYTYSFKIFCPFDIDNAAYGTRWAVRSFNTFPVYLGYYTFAPGTSIATSIFNNSVTAFDGTTNVSGTTVSGTGNIAIIEGIYTPDADGTLSVRVSNDGGAGSATVTVKAGAYIEYYETAI
jgi:hypothetical protein